MGDIFAHKPSTQPEVVADTLDDSQVHDTQREVVDDSLTEVGSTLYASDTIPLSPTSTDVTDTSGEGLTASQGRKKDAYEAEKGEKTSIRKRKKSKLDVMGELLDKMIEKSDKMLMDLELKRARLEKKQMERDMQMQRKEREFQLQVLNLLS